MTGILRNEPTNEALHVWRNYLAVNNALTHSFDILQNNFVNIFTTQDVRKIGLFEGRKDARQRISFAQLLMSFAPEVPACELIKSFLLLTLLGGSAPNAEGLEYAPLSCLIAGNRGDSYR